MAPPTVTVADFFVALDRLHGEEDYPISVADRRSMEIAEGPEGIGLNGWLMQRPALATAVATLFTHDDVREALGDKHLAMARLFGVDRSEVFRVAQRRWVSASGFDGSFWDGRFPSSDLIRPELSSGRPWADEKPFQEKLFAFYERVHQSFEERLANPGRYSRVAARRSSMDSLVRHWEDFRHELLALMLDPEILDQWGADADPVIARFLRDFVSPQTRWLIRHLAQSDPRRIPSPNPFRFFSAASFFPGNGLRILDSEVRRVQRGNSLGMIGISWRGCRTKYAALLLHPAVASELTENEVIRLWREIELVYEDGEARRALKRVAALIDDAEPVPAVKFKDPPPVRPVPEERPRTVDPKLFWQLIAVVRQFFFKRFPLGWDVAGMMRSTGGLLEQIGRRHPDYLYLYGYLALLLDPQVQEKLGPQAKPLIKSYLAAFADKNDQKVLRAYAVEMVGPEKVEKKNYFVFVDEAKLFPGIFLLKDDEIVMLASDKTLADICRKRPDLRTKYLALLLCPEVYEAIEARQAGLASSFLREILGTFAGDSGLTAFQRLAALSPTAVVIAAEDVPAPPALEAPAVAPEPTPPSPLPEPDLEALWRLVNDPSYGRISYNRFPLVRQDILLLQRQKGDMRRVLTEKPAIARALVGYLCWEDLSWRLSDPFKTIAPWLLSFLDWKSFSELEPMEDSTGENIYQRFFARFSCCLGDILFTPLEVTKLQNRGLAAMASGNPAVIAKLVGALFHPRAKESGVAALVLADIFRVAPQIRTGQAKINDLLNPPSAAATAGASEESAAQPEGPRNRPASYHPEGAHSWREWAAQNGRQWHQSPLQLVGSPATTVRLMSGDATITDSADNEKLSGRRKRHRKEASLSSSHRFSTTRHLPAAAPYPASSLPVWVRGR